MEWIVQLRGTTHPQGARYLAAQGVAHKKSDAQVFKTQAAASKASARMSAWPERGIVPVKAKLKPANPQPEISCSFCGKSRQDVRLIIAGPACYICDECVLLSAEIVEEKYPTIVPVVQHPSVHGIRIEIQGRAGAGKTTLALFLQEALLGAGFRTVNVHDVALALFPDQALPELQATRLDSIRERTRIAIVPVTPIR